MKESSNFDKNFGHKKFGRRGEKGGFIEIIVVIIIALIALHLLGVSLSDILSKQATQDFAIYVRDLLKLVWADILEIVQFIKNLPAAK